MIKKLFLFLCVVLCSCSKVVNGNVTEKQYNPPFMTMMPIYISCGKNCTSFIYVPVYYPPSWDIVVTGLDKNGDLAKNTFYISKEKWDLIRKGDLFVCGENNHCPSSERERIRKD